MIRITCPSCGKKIRAHDKHAGMAAPCPDCKALLWIPASENAPSTDQTAQPSVPVEAEASEPPSANDAEFGVELVPIDAIQAAPPPPQPTPIVVPKPPLTFRCPHCHTAQSIGMEFAGQVANCAKCGLMFQLPIPQAESNVTTPSPGSAPAVSTSRSVLEFPPEPEGAAYALPRRRNRGNGVFSMVLALVGFALYFGMMPFAWLYRGPIAESVGVACCVGSFRLLGLFMGVAATFIGSQGQSEDPNDGTAKAGFVLGLILTILLVIEVLLVTVVAILIFDALSLQQRRMR